MDRLTLEVFSKFINKYIGLIPMCFASMLVWLMIDDPFMAKVLFSFGFLFAIPLIVWAIIVFLQSFWEKGFMWNIYMIWGFAIIILTGAYYISPTRFGTKCNPNIMVEHYEKNKSGLQNLIDYTNQSLDKGAQMQLEFEHGKISIFHVMGNNDSIWSRNWDVHSENRTDSLMHVVGLNQKELDNIRGELNKMGCISIDIKNGHSDYVDIGFRRVDLGLYSYRIYNRPLNAEEKKEYIEDPMFIPYTDNVLLKYGGGAIGPQSFGEDIKKEFMKKHPVK